ncbi:hypothetical protein E2562_032691 [Oryza meyeriana var. granulata]|uniref:Uncharacterized protein n=1 Tax=Oryza meyeriana var. granulata TaxID=110450 RepID=A0A6G1FEZ2_9ORYZ|nr:hypothetical protein E2562_032691 [Oryza meyeriana var. granulata]
MEGKKRRTIHMPDAGGDDVSVIHQTQGRLCALNVDPLDIFKLLPASEKKMVLYSTDSNKLP